MSETVIFSDLHAQVNKLRAVIDYYGDTVEYVANGDSIDGSDTRETLNIFAECGIKSTIGNHEWVLMAALTDRDVQRRKLWQDEVWDTPHKTRRVESGTFTSYGIDINKGIEYRRSALKETMQGLGHLALLQQMRMYFETADFLLIHAGTDTSKQWDRQRAELDVLQEKADAYIFDEKPRQIFDFSFCRSARPPRDIWKKTLITGHSHDRRTASDRIWYQGIQPIRIRLASKLTEGDPLFVYEVQNQLIREF